MITVTGAIGVPLMMLEVKLELELGLLPAIVVRDVTVTTPAGSAAVEEAGGPLMTSEVEDADEEDEGARAEEDEDSGGPLITSGIEDEDEGVEATAADELDGVAGPVMMELVLDVAITAAFEDESPTKPFHDQHSKLCACLLKLMRGSLRFA